MDIAKRDSARMARQRSRDTSPEIAIRALIHKRGLRYRVHHKVPGIPRRTIDIAFPRARVAVFVDGCFWHGCPQHGKLTAKNLEYWSTKIQRNCQRDLETTRHLADEGWLVLRYWEHDDAIMVADHIESVVRSR